MPLIKVKQLLDAGIHFGHRASRWNPKMRSYIYGKRQLIHIIDVRQTLRSIGRAQRFLSQVASKGSLILFVGTKRQAAETIEGEARRCAMPFVNQRWLGGTLTNFRTVRSRLQRLEELESIEGTGALDTYSKKMQSSLMRERRKMHRNLDGIREMNRQPEALVVIDPNKEHLAVKEAIKLGIPTVALIDTDGDPDLVDLPIPGNDDSIRSIELVLRELTDAVMLGRASLSEKEAEATIRTAAEPAAESAAEPTAELESEPEAASAEASPVSEEVKEEDS